MISKKEVDDAIHTLISEVGMGSDEENDIWRDHLCSLIISGTKSAFLLKIAFDCASWTTDRTIRNAIWLNAIQRGVEMYEKLNKNSKDYRDRYCCSVHYA